MAISLLPEDLQRQQPNHHSNDAEFVTLFLFYILFWYGKENVGKFLFQYFLLVDNLTSLL